MLKAGPLTSSSHWLFLWMSYLFWCTGEVTPLDHQDSLTLRTERARILSSSTSYQHLVTSSTLSWARVEDVLSGRIPSSLVILVENTAVCRVRDGSRLRPGRTDLSGSCIAGPGLVKHSNYQVLVNPTRLSRYEWKYWDMYRRPEPGTLAFNDVAFVASFRVEDGPRMVGELDFSRGLNGNIKAFVTETRTELSTQGTALVEIQPISYVLDNIELDRARGRSSSSPVLLGESRLQRTHSTGEEDTNDWEYTKTSINYSHPVSHYWGHIPGTVKGLPAKIKGSTRQLRWGLEWTGVEEGTWTLGEYLLPATAVNVTLQAEETSSEIPYTATLVQIYEDGKEVEVNVSGVLEQTSLQFIRQVAEKPMFLESGLAAPVKPTTTTTSTTTATTTTTATASTILLDDTMAWASDDAGASPAAAGNYTMVTAPPTLFPPTVATSSTPNPLRMFYPLEEEEQEDDITIPDKFPDAEQFSSRAAPATPHSFIIINALSPIIAFLSLLNL